MDVSRQELLRQVQEMIQASERRSMARYDKIENAIDKCRLAMGGMASSLSTPATSGVCCVTEVPAPASSNHDACTDASPLDTDGCVAEVPAPACPSYDQDAFFSSTGASMVELLREGVPEPVTMLEVPQGSSSSASHIKEAIGFDPSACTGFITTAPATCSTDCLSQQPKAAPVLVVSSPPTRTEYVLDTNTVHIAAVPRDIAGELSAVPCTDNELFMSSSSQCITIKVPIHRPIPWPSFMCVHADGDEARPLPWPSLLLIYAWEFPSDAIEMASQWCLSDSSGAKMFSVIKFQITGLCGNLFSSTGCIIIHNLCNSSEWRGWDDVFLLLQHCGSATDCAQSVQTCHTTLVWLPCTASWFRLLVMVRSLELKLLSNGSMPVTLQTVLLDSGSFAASSCQYWDSNCISAVTICLSCSQEPNHYFCSCQLKESLILYSARRSMIWQNLGKEEPKVSGSFALQLAVETVLWCNAEELPSFVISAEVLQYDEDQWKLWALPLCICIIHKWHILWQGPWSLFEYNQKGVCLVHSGFSTGLDHLQYLNHVHILLAASTQSV